MESVVYVVWMIVLWCGKELRARERVEERGDDVVLLVVFVFVGVLDMFEVWVLVMNEGIVDGLMLIL